MTLPMYDLVEKWASEISVDEKRWIKTVIETCFYDKRPDNETYYYCPVIDKEKDSFKVILQAAVEYACLDEILECVYKHCTLK